jgi:hypothetical protein
MSVRDKKIVFKSVKPTRIFVARNASCGNKPENLRQAVENGGINLFKKN